MSSPFAEILIVLLLLVANGVFVMVEIAVVSARKGRLQQLAEEGSPRARTAFELANNPNQFLSTVQIGMTLVGMLTGVFSGATIAETVAAAVQKIPFLAPYSKPLGLGLVVIVITYFSMIIAELVPKRLALNNAERIAMATAAPMRTLSALAAPLVWLLSVSTDVVIRLLGVKPSTEPPVTQEEIELLIEQGAQSGVLEETEQDLLERVLRLDDRRVGSVMTVRPQIMYFDVGDSPDAILRKIEQSGYSWFPVVKDDLDNVVGIVRATSLLTQSLTNQPFNLQPLLHPPMFVPESTTALEVLELFKEKGMHFALVTNEYGGIEGLVTHSDILETIVGAIPSMGETTEPEIFQREDGSWLLDGMLSIDTFKEVFNFEELPDEQDVHYNTIGGFVMSQIGMIPSVGQRFEWGGLRFEVVDMDGRRVDKVLMTAVKSVPASGKPAGEEGEVSI